MSIAELQLYMESIAPDLEKEAAHLLKQYSAVNVGSEEPIALASGASNAAGQMLISDRDLADEECDDAQE